jgi:hypothetical protein
MSKLIVLAVFLLGTTAPAFAEKIPVSAGQPLCADQASLQVMLTAALTGGKEPSVPCEGIKPNSTADVIERYPSGANGMRVVKVKVAAPGRGPVVGYTMEIGAN